MTSAYSKLGVHTTEELVEFPRMLDILRGTFAQRADRVGQPRLDFGLYANVLDLGNNLGLAISTDGVGTKAIVAEKMRRYDTIGIDCIAMNVNDIICVGAEPIAMTDYVATDRIDGEFLSQLAQGLAIGAELSNITIPGGEIAQVGEMVRGFDIVGTCVGVVPIDRIITGRNVQPGDAIVGFASSGIHSNGLTLARQVLIRDDERRLNDHIPEFGRTLGEELLEPTRIYVSLAMRLMRETDVRALAHVTSDGFLNLARTESQVGFDVSELPEVPPVFERIQAVGGITPEEMFLVFNMGIGFCVIVPEQDCDRVISIAREESIAAMRIGTCTADAGLVTLRTVGLQSRGGHFERF